MPGWWQSFTEAAAAIAPALPERIDRGEKVKKGRPKPVKINRSVPVDDDEGLVESFAQPLDEDAGDQVGSAAGRERDDHLDGAGRVGLVGAGGA